jgi:hypothetical protein
MRTLRINVGIGLFAVIASALGACSGGGGGGGGVDPASQADQERASQAAKDPATRAKEALAKDMIVTSESRGAGDAFVVLIGEQHSHVRTQQEVARALEALHGASLLDVFLVEGFNGKLDIATRLPPQYKDAKDGRRFASDELAWGHIAAKEYFALLHPDVPVVGIEDVAARLRFERLLEQRMLDPTLLRTHHEAELAEIDKAGQCLAAQGVGGAEALAQSLRKTVSRRHQALTTAMTAFGANAAKYWELEEKGIELQSNTEVKHDLEEFQLKYQGKPEALAGLEPDTKIERIATWWADSSKLHEARQAEEKHLLPRIADITAARRASRDAFTVAVSELGNRDPQRKCTDTLAHFRTKVLDPMEDRVISDADLTERDDKMVANILDQVRSTDRPRHLVALVGAFHLPNLSARLAQANVPYLAVKARSTEEPTLQWENRAWDTRKGTPSLAFKAIAPDDIGPTFLQSPRWFAEHEAQAKMLVDAQQSAPSLGSIAFRNDREVVVRTARDDREADLHITSSPGDPSVDFGAHMRSRGPVPGQPDKIHELVDLQVARNYVNQFSTKGDVYVFPRYAGDGTDSIVVEVPGRKLQGPPKVLDEGAFLKAAPGGGGAGKPPRRVVVISGAEENAGWSRFWSDARRRGPNGEVAWTSTVQRAPKTQVFRTVNPERAQKHLAALDKQQPAWLGSVRVVRGPQLQGLLPTPERGDNARLVIFIAENVAELRAAVDEAGRNGLLEGKQVVLITCGHAYDARHNLVESVLGHGALLAWMPNRQVPVTAGERLAKEILDAVPEKPNAETARMPWIIRRALHNWQMKAPDDPELRLFEDSDWWTAREGVVTGDRELAG